MAEPSGGIPYSIESVDAPEILGFCSVYTQDRRCGRLRPDISQQILRHPPTLVYWATSALPSQYQSSVRPQRAVRAFRDATVRSGARDWAVSWTDDPTISSEGAVLTCDGCLNFIDANDRLPGSVARPYQDLRCMERPKRISLSLVYSSAKRTSAGMSRFPAASYRENLQPAGFLTRPIYLINHALPASSQESAKAPYFDNPPCVRDLPDSALSHSAFPGRRRLSRTLQVS
ncbi:uncharacterized protein CLUP02_06780 [Colletotrichum lupini]|uniref:Uncharacterized protein n=1 Tax=Colletotrichum lupini TaxID=145971 RepID=A0A9Q8WFD1_9PEZI|nr:uncharacterized protein CLUP02_06780 [Colletotrichum lupini]UQC81294.1 hypothetical protein CLUP02_06780 [Colletotrichum lupini]